jgi:glucose-6-phosphate isomerase
MINIMNLEKFNPDIRELKDIEDVVFDKEWLKTAKSFELYYMYRDLSENEEDHDKIFANNLRYDITIMFPKMLGKEFNKTIGHDHPIVPGTSITYPELYEVLEGEAIFLLQDSKNEQIKDVFAIKAKTGNKVVIPPNYEHLIINASDKDLKTCNWICRSFGSNIYKPFKLRHGFCYYATKTANGIEWIKNENYTSVPEIRFEQANNLYDFKIEENEPIYNLVNNLAKLEFLENPQNHEWSLDSSRDKN